MNPTDTAARQLRDTFLAQQSQAADSRRPVPVPGTPVFVPVMMGDELVRHWSKIEAAGKDEVRKRGVELANVVVDEHGTRLFEDRDAHDLPSRLLAAVQTAVLVKFREVNSLDPDPKD